MNQIPDSLLETMWDDGEFTLSRAIQDSVLPRVFITVPSLTHPSPSSIARLENAFALRDELQESWASCPRALVRDHGRLTLLSEDPGGELLQRLLGKPMAIEVFLDIAIGIANALAHCHDHGIIHKDIRPANICVKLSTGDAWLMGFGIASHMPRERQLPDPPEMIAGSLSYMAPEQTGRMNRSVDSRSDLYALGVTFYEMLSGATPFTATDPMGWVHCHIAMQPLALYEQRTDVPAHLSAIVMALLAKDAEERYQTAHGLAFDLRQCRDMWNSRGDIPGIPLRTRDVSPRLNVAERLYGRDREVASLSALLGRVIATGQSELALVSGYAGIGKSSIVNELHKLLVSPRGMFTEGKFDQYRRDIPYASLSEACRSLIRQILVQSDDQMNVWRNTLTAELGEDGGLIVSIVPDLEQLIGRQPKVGWITPGGVDKRFRAAFHRFLSVFARAEHPLVLFLDDLQWLDSATLNLLEYLVVEAPLQYLLLIGAYRDNEIDATHPLTRIIEVIRTSDAHLEEIVLHPLAHDDIEMLIADSLHMRREQIGELAQVIVEHAGGNPYFTVEFLTLLVDENLIAFDTETGAWRWGIETIRAQRYTDNVIEIITGKLARISVDARNIVARLACIGSSATADVLTRVLALSRMQIESGLMESARTGLLYRFEERYQFVHDRVQEAAYNQIATGDRASVHLEIGRLMLAEIEETEADRRIYEVVDQFNRGCSAITSIEERDLVGDLNLRAGKKAVDSTAYALGYGYMRAGLVLVDDEKSWERVYDLRRELQHYVALHEIGIGDFDGAQSKLDEILRHSQIPAHRHAAYSTLAHIAIMHSDFPRAFANARACFEVNGIDLPEVPTRQQLDEKCAEILRRIDGIDIASLVDLSPAQSQQEADLQRVLTVIYGPAFSTLGVPACIYPCMLVLLTLNNGLTEHSYYGFGTFGMLLGQLYGKYREGLEFGRLGYAINERSSTTRNWAGAAFGLATTQLFAAPLSEAVETFRQCFASASANGSVALACGTSSSIVGSIHVRGDHLDVVLREAEDALRYAESVRHRNIAERNRVRVRLVQSLRGQSRGIATFDDADFDELSFEKQLGTDPADTLSLVYWTARGMGRFIAGDYVAASDSFDQARRFLSPLIGLTRFEYAYYEALTLAALDSPGVTDANGPQLRGRIREHAKLLALWAESSPTTFADKSMLVEAELARLDGHELDAMRLYERAIQLAQDNGFIQNEAIANETAARFYRDQGFETTERAYLRVARYCYSRWGAVGKVRQLDHHHPHLSDDDPTQTSRHSIDAALDQLDAVTVVRASQALSSEIVLDRLIEILMRLAIEHAGAQRGLLITPHDDAYSIVASARIERDALFVEQRMQQPTSDSIPLSLLNLTLRIGEIIIVEDASTDPLFASDEYVRSNILRSALCLPLMNQGQTMGVLYLENNLIANAFTPDRVAVLQLLASQAAISLRVARLYNELEGVKDQLYNENVALREEVDKTLMFEEIVGTSQPLRAVLSRVEKVAPTDSTVLVYGETGTGKELIARAIHKRSMRADRPFISVNCAAIPHSLIASELFGHEKGAFTGALQRRLGRFELAAGGTIFLDEIGEIPLETQITLLRVLQEHEFERVGGITAIHADVRVIAATNRDLPTAISLGLFRSDLYYRLNVFPIEMPSLRERSEDIPLLVEYFIARFATKAGKHIVGVARKTLQMLQDYPWPGNIRELQNVIERSVILCDGPTFSIDESWLAVNSDKDYAIPDTLTLKLQDREKTMIETALAESRGRVAGPTGAAAKLGIPPSTLDSKIRALNIDKYRFKKR
jgi:transcriptional regulator with GAF, ATPase, and Fis domain/predicted ATPase